MIGSDLHLESSPAAVWRTYYMKGRKTEAVIQMEALLID